MAWFRFPLLLHRFHHFHLYHQHNNLHNERIYFYLVSLIFLFSSVLVNPMVIDVFSDNGKPIRPVSCFDAKGNKGTCMFSLACRQSKGKPIGICKDTIYAKSCCQLPGDQPKPSNGFTSNIYSTTVPKLPSSTLTTTTKTTQVLTTLTTSSSSLPSPSPPPLPSPSSLPSPSPLPSSPPTTNATQTSTTQAPITKTTPTTPTTSTSTTPSTTTAAPTTGLTNGTNLTTTGRPTVTTPVVEKESSSTSTMSPTVTLSSSPLILQESSSTIGQTIADHPSSITPLPATLPTTMISTSAKTEATLSSLPWISSSTTTHVTSSSSTTEPTTILNTETTLSTDTISTIISSSTSSSFLTDTVTETVTTEMPSSPFSTASTDLTSTSTTASSSPSTKLSTLFTEISSVSPLAISSSQSITSTPITPATLPDSVGNLLNKILNVQRPYNNKLDCGVSPLKSMARVVGGRNAHFGEWPWQVLIKEATWLGLWMKTKCGGVLIDHRWVLTAAHCQPGFWGSLLVVVGEYDLTGDVENLKPIQKPVKRMIVHRNYNPTTFENDIALMELESPFDVQPHVVPICLPEPGEEFVGQVAHVAGWGKLSYGGPIPSILQVVKLPILANDKCQEMFNNAGHDKEIKSTFLCAGYTDGGKDSCEGDSGGPLMVQKSNGHWVLVGTVSHGIKCAEPNLPGVYMKTAAYRLWIDNIINKTVNQNNTNQTSSNNNNNISKTQLKT